MSIGVKNTDNLTKYETQCCPLVLACPSHLLNRSKLCKCAGKLGCGKKCNTLNSYTKYLYLGSIIFSVMRVAWYQQIRWNIRVCNNAVQMISKSFVTLHATQVKYTPHTSHSLIHSWWCPSPLIFHNFPYFATLTTWAHFHCPHHEIINLVSFIIQPNNWTLTTV